MAMRQYSDELKAQVLAALLQGQSINAVAREYKIPKGTVSNWKNRYKGPKDGTQKKEIGELILEYLAANLAALRVQAEVFSDPEWLEKQSAESVAVLHGVMTDKAVRLLEAFGEREA